MLKVGSQARDFSLPRVGGGQRTLYEALKKGPVLLIFYKYNCPTCQLTLPFLQRIFDHLSPLQKTSVIAIAQDGEPESVKFAKDFGLKFEVLYDVAPYPVSQAYDLSSVPTRYWIEANGEVTEAYEAFDKKALMTLASKLAIIEGKGIFEIFRPEDQVPLLKPG